MKRSRTRHSLLAAVLLSIAPMVPRGAMAWNQDQSQTGGTQTQQQTGGTQSQTATGGASNATGGKSRSNAAGGNASATGGQGGQAGQGVANTGPVSVTTNSTAGRPVASAIAPAMMSVNPCLQGAASAALQTGVLGLGFGLTPGYDEACRLHQLGEDEAARAYLCRTNTAIRQAFADIGRLCPQDLPPVAVPEARSPRDAVSAPKAVMMANTLVSPPDYCLTRNAGDKNQHRECDQKRIILPSAAPPR